MTSENTDALAKAIKEVRELREHDERQALLESIAAYNAAINYGNPLVENERVRLTLRIALKDGVGEFIPSSVNWR